MRQTNMIDKWLLMMINVYVFPFPYWLYTLIGAFFLSEMEMWIRPWVVTRWTLWRVRRAANR